VTVNGTPTVGAGGPYNGVEGAGVTLNGTATDPEADTLTTSWTYTVVSADPGAACTLTSGTTLTPTLTCTDDATLTVTLHATDGVNPAVVSSATVQIDNVAPLVAARSSPRTRPRSERPSRSRMHSPIPGATTTAPRRSTGATPARPAR